MLTRRIFVGVGASTSSRKAIERKMRDFDTSYVRPTAPENLHLTLSFAGHLDDVALAELIKNVGAAVENIEPFDLLFDRIVLGPDEERAKMIWLVATEPSKRLAELKTAVERVRAPQRPEHRSFRSHITLGRIIQNKWRKLKSKPQIDRKVSIVWPIEEVTIYESVVIDNRRTYVPLSAVLLKGKFDNNL